MTLLTVEEFREHVTTTLGDDAVQRLLDASEGEITALYGPVGEATDIIDGGQSYIFLRRRTIADSIDTITETDGLTDTELDTDDWRLRGDGVSILRLGTGTNPRSWWGAPITVVYDPTDDLAERKILQLALVQLDLNYVPGNATSEQIGAWQESRIASGISYDYTQERLRLLDSLLTVLAPGFA